MTQGRSPEAPPESSIDLPPPESNSSLRYAENPGSIRIPGSLAKKLALAHSPTERYHAAVDLQEELVRNMKVEKKTIFGKIFKNRLTKTALLVGAGALLPSAFGAEGWIASAFGKASSLATGLGESSAAQGVANAWENLDDAGKKSVSLAGAGFAGLGVYGIYRAGKRLLKGKKKQRRERRDILAVLHKEQKDLRENHIKVRKDHRD